MRLRFTKMHGIGNDFVVIDAISQAVQPTREQVRQLADRHFGVGCDQVLLVEAPVSSDVDFRYRIFNADGGEVEQCGNGARCFARFVRDKGLSNKDEIAVETLGGVICPKIESDGQVSVKMGIPEFRPDRIPFQAPGTEVGTGVYRLEIEGRMVEASVLSMGNPHAVVQVEDVDTAPVQRLGSAVQGLPAFPKSVNVGFMQVLGRSSLRLRVYERGAGETLACGTGACAAVVAGRRLGLLDAKVRVSLPGGELEIGWEDEGDPVWLTGPAVTVFEGEIDLE